MAKKNSLSEEPPLLPAIPGMELLPDQTTVDDDAAPRRGSSGFLKLNKAGRYEVSNEDLGPEILVMITYHRNHAVLWAGGEKTLESYQSKSETYQKIKNSPKGQEGTTDGPAVGPEFLIWLIA